MTTDPPIVLIGMMLSGKSTVGRRLAERLDRSFVDLDEAIVQSTGRSISEWFELGESAFRAAERETLQRCLEDGSFGVIATGGGVVLDEQNRRMCRSSGFVVYLEATPEELAARAPLSSGRPLLDGAGSPRDALARLLHTRQDHYVATQHVRLPAGRADVDELVAAIVRAYETRADNRSR